MNESYDLPLARARRNEAIDAATQAADEEWRAVALMALCRIARGSATFTTDDVWKSVPSPREPRAIAGVMLEAKRLGLCEPTSTYQQSERVRCHARPLRVWRSLEAA